MINYRENSALAQKVLDGFPKEYRDFVDDSMYSSKQQLRLFQSQKPGSGRPKIFVDKWQNEPNLVKYSYPQFDDSDENEKEGIRFTALFAASCVTVTDNCQIISVLSEELHIIKSHSYKTFDPNDGDDIIDDAILKAVCDRVDPQVFLVYSIYKITGALILLKRQRPAKCTLCDRVHEKENAFFRVSKLGKVYFHCRRNDN